MAEGWQPRRSGIEPTTRISPPFSGYGVKAEVEGHQIKVGNLRMMQEIMSFSTG